MTLNSSILYEPNASVMKAGCFHELETAFGIRQLSENSHLFITDRPIPLFPGRAFDIVESRSLNKKDSRALSALGQANITTRNFPMRPEEIRRKLKLKDGGDTYLFATTDAQGRHIIYVCHRAEKNSAQ